MKFAVRFLAVGLTATASFGAQAQAHGPASGGGEAASPAEMLAKGRFFGTARSIYYSTHNNFWSGTSQDTISYGGRVGFETARLQGFSAGISGLVQRGIGHSDDPSRVDFNLGPNITALGEAYVQWQHDSFKATVGNQQLNVPFASYDFRMVPQMFRGVSLRMGDADNYATAFRMTSFKSYTSEHFTRTTTYNAPLDNFSPAKAQETSGFWGVGGARKHELGDAILNGQAWFFNYQDYARLFYAEGQIAKKQGQTRPFAGAQVLHEDGDGAELAGRVRSRVYGLQLGVRRDSITATLGYNRITPQAGAYLNGALVTPYAHKISSGPMFAAPFLSSVQDLGAGNAYALEVKGSPAPGWLLGSRFSYMDLKSSASARSQEQKEILLYAMYNFSGQLKGLSATNFLGRQTSPLRNGGYLQNRLTMQYQW